jgi:hypothetical protein
MAVRRLQLLPFGRALRDTGLRGQARTVIDFGIGIGVVIGIGV